MLLQRTPIARAALAFIDAHGLEALSTRKLAAELGCEAMTLYHHFPSKGALLDAVAEQLTDEITLPAEAGPGLRGFLDASEQLYRLARRHPFAFPLLATRRANTPGALRFYDRLVGLLLASGVTPEDAALLFRVVGYYTLGAGLARVATFAQAPDATRPVLESPAALPEIPSLERVAPFLTRARVDALYRRGLSLVCGALLKEVGARGRAAPARARRRRTAAR